MHDDQIMDLEQQFAEAKHVIRQLAGQVDHYSNTHQQLAGLPIIRLCSSSLFSTIAIVLFTSHPPVQASPLVALFNALALACAACASADVIPLIPQTLNRGATHSFCCNRTKSPCLLLVEGKCLRISAETGAGVTISVWCTVVQYLHSHAVSAEEYNKIYIGWQQHDLAGLAEQLGASQQEVADLQCTARMYHQAMDECQRLQSENVALRQMLQNALEDGPERSARSSSRGRKQTSRGTDSVMSVLKPHMSFVAEHESAHDNHSRSCSPTMSRYCQPDPVYDNFKLSC